MGKLYIGTIAIEATNREHRLQTGSHVEIFLYIPLLFLVGGLWWLADKFSTGKSAAFRNLIYEILKGIIFTIALFVIYLISR